MLCLAAPTAAAAAAAAAALLLLQMLHDIVQGAVARDKDRRSESPEGADRPQSPHDSPTDSSSQEQQSPKGTAQQSALDVIVKEELLLKFDVCATKKPNKFTKTGEPETFC